MELGSSAAVRSAVAAGEGPALISELVVAADLAADSLVEIPTTKLALRRSLHAVWKAGTHPSESARELLRLATRRPHS
jgi:DNA-binding transcriptional LysR family regulator